MAYKRIDFSDVQWQSLALSGVAVQTAAIFTAYYRPIQMGQEAVANSVTSPASVVFSLALAALFVAAGTAARPLRHMVETPGALVVAAVLFVGSSWAATSLPPDGAAAMGLDFAARAGSAFLMLGWFCVFSNFDSDTVLQTLPATMALGVAVILLTVCAGPGMRLPCLVALTLVSTAWLILATRKTRISLPDGEIPTTECPAQSDGTRLVRRHERLTCGTAFLLSLLLGILCALPFHSTSDVEDRPFFLYFLLMMGVALLLLAFISLSRRDNPLSRPLLAARVAGPALLTVLCLILGTVLQPPLDPLANAVGRMAMELSLIVCFLLTARHFALSPLRTYTFGQAAFLVGNLLGMFLGLQIPLALGTGADGLLVASVTILLLTTEALFVLVVLYHISQRLAARIAAAAAVEEPPASTRTIAPTVTDGNLDAFVEAFHLSDKEAEVLSLTVRGRSRQRIAEALFVSPGTVNTYFYRIYQKTDVHKRQELLDKIEEFQSNALSAK